jgi:hypothetical protein
MTNMAKLWTGLTLAAVLATGCTKSNEPADQKGGATTPDAAYLLVEMPADAQAVEQARKVSQDDEVVAVEGRIGGSAKPFVDGIAAFTIVDPKLQWCAEDEGCPTPWDYCCADKAGKTAMVKVVGPDGQPVSKDARELLGVKELSKVVVRGKAQRDDQGNLTVLAEKVHVAKD